MSHDDVTIADILKDPLIRQMMRADRVSSREMKKLLQAVARGQGIDSRPRYAGNSGRESSPR